MKPLTVLIVDDDEVTLQIVAALLESQGYEVSTRSRSLGTTALILQLQPDVVLLDVKMPGLDGAELLRLSRERGHSGTDYILYSSMAGHELTKLANEGGALGCIPKDGDHATFLRRFTQLTHTLES